jgi:hypothetical protein
MLTVGVLSALLVLGAFIANEFGAVRANNIWYDVANFLGSAGLLVYALETNSWPFVLTNSVWGAVSLYDLLRCIFGAPRRRWHTRRV